jgi:hypothetical protein
MLVSDIVRRVRDSAGDLAVLQFSNATLTDWINDGIQRCVIENSLLQAKASSATVIGQTDYTLPADIFKLHSVWVDGYKLTVQSLQEWEELNATEHGATLATSGAQYSCYVYAGVLTLWPSPTAVKNIQINYTKLPAQIVYTSGPDAWNPDTPQIPVAYHQRIVAYCLAQVALQDEDFNKYSLLMQEFTTGVVSLDIKGEDDLYPFISVSVRDQGEGDWTYYG